MSDQSIHPAYRLLYTVDLPEYNGRGLLLEHEMSGAQVFHIQNDDDENAFAFAFPTYPEDSTGVAHILEHTVLSGSERYPVKDPFLQLMKGSVNTFLNAMTYPDRTVYPAASPVKADLFNLLDVYGDAVFFPLLKPELFRQEGHRLQFTEDGSLEISGVVYNEMKGNYSSHDSIVGELCYQSLFPDTIYRHDSGGDPRVIPDLTYEQFAAFHRRYYHPSNARIFLYGSIPTAEYLQRLDERFLSRFKRGSPVEPIPAQPRWSEPRRIDATYPVDGEDLTGRSSVTINWLLAPVIETDRLLEYSVLSEILLGHSGSPLARTLIESGLGQDLSPVVGIESDIAEAVFSVGLRGTEPDRREAIEDLVFATLRELVENGIDSQAIEAALRRVEFREREIKSGPAGLRAMRRALRAWIYGARPEEGLAIAGAIDRLRSRLEIDPRCFETIISRDLLENPHRSIVTVRPDATQNEREERELRYRLAARRDAMSEVDRQTVLRETEELERMQATPDDPEALAAIPYLSSAEIPLEVRHIDRRIDEHARGGPVYIHDFGTNGIAYIDLAFEFDRLTDEQELLLNLLGASFSELGLPGVPWSVLQEEIGLKTGGLTAYTMNQTRYRDLSEIRRFFVIRLKVLERAWREGADLLARLLTETDFSDGRRLTQVIDELRQDMMSALIPHGHYFSGLRAGIGLSRLPALEERLNGVTQYRALAQFADRAPAETGGALAQLLRTLADPARLTVNLCAEGPVLTEIGAWIDELAGTLAARVVPPGGEASPGAAAPGAAEDAAARLESTTADGAASPPTPRQEYLLTSARVSYVAQAIPALRFGEEDYAAQDLLAHVLRTGPLWEKIRMEGGAYGAFATNHSTEGYFSFGSYRDPRTAATLTAYREALQGIAAVGVDEATIDQARVALLGRELKPLKPREASFIDFRRGLYDVDDALRRRIREDLQAVDSAALQRVASRLLAGIDSSYVCVLGGTGGLDELRAQRDGDVQVTELGV